MGCLKCRGTSIDICHKPKASDQQLDMLHNMIKCLCKCGDAEDNIGGGTDTGGDSTGGGNSDGGTGGGDTGGGTGTGGEEPTTPIINTEWVVSNVTVGSSCGKCLIQASRTKDNIKVFSDIEVIPDVQQVSNEIIAGNYGTEVNNAVLAIDPAATDWVLDPANNAVRYADTSIDNPNSSPYLWWAVRIGHDVTFASHSSAAAQSCTFVGGGAATFQKEHSESVVTYKCAGLDGPISIAEIRRISNPNYDPDAPAHGYKYIPIETVAAQVISNGEACDIVSKIRLADIVMPLAYSGFYNDLFEANIHYGEI